MFEHLNNFHGLMNCSNIMSLELDEEVQALLLLTSLPDSWETLVSIMNFASGGVVTLKMVKKALYNEETKRKDQGLRTSNTSY